LVATLHWVLGMSSFEYYAFYPNTTQLGRCRAEMRLIPRFCQAEWISRPLAQADWSGHLHKAELALRCISQAKK
jgi:hypothetical protein